MGALDTTARATALNLLAKFGASGTYTHRLGTEVYDVTTSTLVPSETTYPDVKMFVSDRIQRFFTKTDLAAAGVEIHRAILIAGSALTFAPKMNDRITLGAETFRVGIAVPTYSGDQVALWTIGVSR